ncbi:peptidoglycan hydrolase-like protein with peptidoglycan-binding domain [Isoptericola jiangsuensis]|uniref:Peptidoglycan hydrolase-like protein with peptidoglycan-binding domain n=1 Tax=Isoptericola jiangsuensis TaxID=548579 RepID=A0A2A9EU29_9MICO|nr:peptidoglycan-binding protein [Isoptericola jiangsuensis]PFG41679.1 peptidoglycan hydrolase-like protein with peptidoglycan-binding domain [Isoptericola jiangsuensis]
MNVEPWHTLGTGDEGAAVAGVQYLLRDQGHAVTADGVFGPLTRTAVRTFQSAHGLDVDGVVGRQTWPHLVVSTERGDSGHAVRAVQQFGLLRFPGDPPLVVDGEFGSQTAQRVRFFQESWGLTIDGIAGQETWSFLSTQAPGPRPWPLVKVGSTQDDNWRVRPAQHLLRAHGATLTVDGVFGPVSGAAVRAFQQTLRARFISTTVGQLDWPEMIVTVRRGDDGPAVRAVQVLLGVTADGVFGPVTESAVRGFQSTFAPPDDGVVGPVTWHALTQRLFD